MVLRIKNNPVSQKSSFEKKALKITGTAFYLLSLGLFAGIVINLVTHHKPETTFWGIIISLISIIVMFCLMVTKKKVGKNLNSEPISCDASCTKICVYMSIILLVSSLLFQLTGFSYADIIGVAGLIYFSIKEGYEAFKKAKGKICECDDC
jgi:divalent metal cation (Fe/Co/Zn/Cd) transporter